MQSKAIFFDIDGTLVSFHTHEIVPSAHEAIAALRKKGHKVFIATGRPLHLIKGLGDTRFDGYITFNGSYCLTADGEEIYCDAIPREALHALCRHEKESGPYAYSFMGLDRVTVNRVDDCVVEVARMLDLPVPIVTDMEQVADHERIIQVDLYVDEAHEAPLMQQMPGCFSNRWSPLFTDVNRTGNSKHRGIDIIAAHYGIDLRDTIAFGDGGNDISMLRHAGLGIAMGNAGEAVKHSAGYITDDVDNDGVIKALRHFGLL